ncbi:MAG TPA: CpsD/CapB family tyrosine-protein kinase [Candidatus Polarisedimenticolia bacterium]|nr:CpsD/CapB family tyrosine-protein kinase [Candidatus Polarisedimenticolia bacterium]
MNDLLIAQDRDARARPAKVEARAPADVSVRRDGTPAADSGLAIEEHLVGLLAPNTFEAEQYRGLRALLEQKRKAESLAVIAISSPSAGDGKTLTSINLAGTLAQAPEARILLVDCDLRRPSVEAHLGLGDGGSTGLVEAILDPGLALDQVARRQARFNLSVLTAGRCQGSPYELLKSPRLGELLEEARRRFDYVVVDTPPMVPVPDLRVIAKLVDGILLVVAAHKTPRRLLEEALYASDPTKVVGLIFNNDDGLLSRAYGYYDYGRPVNGAARRRARRMAGKRSAS